MSKTYKVKISKLERRVPVVKKDRQKIKMALDRGLSVEYTKRLSW